MLYKLDSFEKNHFCYLLFLKELPVTFNSAHECSLYFISYLCKHINLPSCIYIF